MKAARIRLIIATIAFVGWLGYLSYLALGHGKPVVISRSQLLSATYFVKADVAVDEAGKPVGLVHVRESFGNQPLNAETVTVENLAEARLPGRKPLISSGTYLLPLERTGTTRYRVVPAQTGAGLEYQSQQFLIYPWIAEVERQVRDSFPKTE